MSTEEFHPDYIAGLLDTTGRFHFNVSEHAKDEFTVRPELRIKPHQSESRYRVLAQFLESGSYSARFAHHEQKSSYFVIEGFSAFNELREYLQGKSAQLIRELNFVIEHCTDQYDGIVTAQDIYQLLEAQDELRYGWRPRGPRILTAERFAADHDVVTDGSESLMIPQADLRGDYSMDWIAGVFDGSCRFRPSVAEDPEYTLDHSFYPVVKLRRPGVTKQFIQNVLGFCDDYSLTVGDASEDQTLDLIFTSSSNIREVVDLVLPYLEVLKQHSLHLLDAILPRFENGAHYSKQGFYELLVDMLFIADKTGGQTRERQFTPEYFEQLWEGEITPLRDDDQPPEPVDPRSDHEYEAIQLDPEVFDDVIGRYETLVDRATRDREKVDRLKERYANECQICGKRLETADGAGYSEVHHIKPLGNPHNGPDSIDNMLVLCPNHHADFDNGVLMVDPETLSVEHSYDSNASGRTITLADEDEIASEYLTYHNTHLTNSA